MQHAWAMRCGVILLLGTITIREERQDAPTRSARIAQWHSDTVVLVLQDVHCRHNPVFGPQLSLGGSSLCSKYLLRYFLLCGTTVMPLGDSQCARSAFLVHRHCGSSRASHKVSSFQHATTHCPLPCCYALLDISQNVFFAHGGWFALCCNWPGAA